MMAAPFRISSYNVLADAYADPKRYPSTAPRLLAWASRSKRVVERVASLSPDFACLQEVDAAAWPELEAAFALRGYRAVFAGKGRQRPDGCALVYRSGGAPLAGWEALHFHDASGSEAPSGHLALIGRFEMPFGPLLVIGTHLRWQQAGANDAAHVGYRQARELLDHCADRSPATSQVLVCGDFNATADSPVVRAFVDAGFIDAYAAAPQATCNPHRRAARIDYLFASEGLRISPEALPAIDDRTVLPSDVEPSDHLPITATVEGPLPPA
jgi:CCR4-NOT transcription complex subunit 6